MQAPEMYGLLRKTLTRESKEQNVSIARITYIKDTRWLCSKRDSMQGLIDCKLNSCMHMTCMQLMLLSPSMWYHNKQILSTFELNKRNNKRKKKVVATEEEIFSQKLTQFLEDNDDD